MAAARSVAVIVRLVPNAKTLLRERSRAVRSSFGESAPSVADAVRL
jgi:hypothetical protein